MCLVFLAVAAMGAVSGCSSNPQDASTPGTAPAPGAYTVEIALSGGSGKATVQSPTTLTVTRDSMTAEVVWSSPYFTWMEVGATRYAPTSAQGENAAFTIPVTLDTDIAVTAETVAMSEPHEIDYTLRLDSATLRSA